jgi:probable F420-dependent oxidoreductase
MRAARTLRVGDLACGRAGDKGATLDLTVVANDRAAYDLLAAELTDVVVAQTLGAARATRYPVPGLLALKFVVPEILGGGVHASLRPGMHWQKTAINALLDLELSGRPVGATPVCVRPPGWIAPDSPDTFAAMRSWAVRAEELGFDGLFVGDRMLPAAVGSEHSRGSVYGASMLEATTTLAALAAVTERILLGPLVLVLPYRHPIQLAKTVATLDVISGGRLILGAGLGWNEAEFTALGLDRSARAAHFEAALTICRALWAGETVSHDGAWTFADVALSPLPARAGGPPVWLASFSPASRLDWTDDVPASARRTLERIGRLGDGWVPLVYSASARRRIDPLVLGRAFERVLDSAGAAGRGRDDIDFIHSDWCYVIETAADEARCREALAGFFSGTWSEAQRTYAIGTADQVAEQLAALTAHIDRVDGYVLTPLGSDPAQLDALTRVRSLLQRHSVAA